MGVSFFGCGTVTTTAVWAYGGPVRTSVDVWNWIKRFPNAATNRWDWIDQDIMTSIYSTVYATLHGNARGLALAAGQTIDLAALPQPPPWPGGYNAVAAGLRCISHDHQGLVFKQLGPLVAQNRADFYLSAGYRVSLGAWTISPDGGLLYLSTRKKGGRYYNTWHSGNLYPWFAVEGRVRW